MTKYMGSRDGQKRELVKNLGLRCLRKMKNSILEIILQFVFSFIWQPYLNRRAPDELQTPWDIILVSDYHLALVVTLSKANIIGTG